VGLDVLEAVCLLTVARLLSRKYRATSPAAAATAAILCMDAWFDTMSAAPKLPYAESLAMACFVELPSIRAFNMNGTIAASRAAVAVRRCYWACAGAAQDCPLYGDMPDSPCATWRVAG